ncbi:MAG: lactate racemase domain-containing protein [Desulfatiglandales bacterium]
MNHPKMYHIRQVIDAPKVTHIEETLSRELESIQIGSQVKAGSRIAVTAGSRGVANMDRILRHLVYVLKGYGAKPFLIPAMGSHGGGTPEGQLEILESFNITEESIGVPVISAMEVVEIGRSSFGFPVLVDKHAAEADGIIVVNRIKPHTEFEGPVESGLMKMMAIGMGKHRGCLEVHKQTINYGYRDVIPAVGRVMLEKLPVLFGVGIVENFYDETAFIRVVPPSRFFKEEEALLVEAKKLMARLPFDKMDVLIVDEMGKNISGTGIDSNVIGRILFIGAKEPENPKITRIVVLDMTEESHGNAVGIGMADYTTERLVSKIDHEATATNAITAMTPEQGRIPIALKTDREAVEAALTTIGAVDPVASRVVHIKNTLELAELHVSGALLEEIRGRQGLELVKELGPLAFDSKGNLPLVK